MGWHFFNYGPLTTTFTQPPSCTANQRTEIGWMDRDIPYHAYTVQCTKEDFPECAPTATVTVTTSTKKYGGGVGAYYSPGLYCPSGWKTVGMAARDEKEDLTMSGAVTVETGYGYPWGWEDYAPTALADLLEPSQTLALCCPSHMTADIAGNCFSIVPSYTPTIGCRAWDQTSYEYETTTMPYTLGLEVTTGAVRFPTETDITRTTDWQTYDDLAFEDMFTPISVVPQVTLIHHQSDLDRQATAMSVQTATGTGASGPIPSFITPTSNAAGNLSLRKSSREGLQVGAVLGLSGAMLALGAAFVFSL
ncbi:unnamed protein product [Penicillium pancosmium]